MEDRFTRRVNMINTTTGYADANPAATAGIAAFGTALNNVKAKIVLINGLNQIGGGSTTGVTADTHQIRTVMEELTLKCASATFVYAVNTNNNTLKAIVDVSADKLKRAKKEDVDDICEAVVQAANTNIAALADYGLTPTDVTDAQTAIDLYRTWTQKTRNAIITRSQAIQQAQDMVTDIVKNYLENQMDKLVDTLKITNKNYWEGWKQAREVIDVGTTTAKVRGAVRDRLTAPLKNVQFKIFETGTLNLVAETLTDEVGNFNVSHLPSGNFDFKWELNGYQEKVEENVHIGPGKELQRKVTLLKIAVLQGDVADGAIVNINANNIEVPDGNNLIIEAVNSDLTFYASDTATGAPGIVKVTVNAGQSITHTKEEWESLLGMNAVKQFINVQNNGGAPGFYKVTVFL